MVNFVGAGPGACDLITVRGKNFIEKADVIIYAGSLINTELLLYAKKDCLLYDSSKMTLEQVVDVIISEDKKNKDIVRLHTGDPSLYGAVKEQMNILDKNNISYNICPGVSSLFGATAALKTEYTIPNVSQTLIVTRMAGRTSVPDSENISLLASHNASMAVFLSSGMLEDLQEELIKGGYKPDTPAAVVYKATWKDEKVIRTTVSSIARKAKENNITKTALIIVGEFLDGKGQRSELYNPYFSHSFRKGID